MKTSKITLKRQGLTLGNRSEILVHKTEILAFKKEREKKRISSYRQCRWLQRSQNQHGNGHSRRDPSRKRGSWQGEWPQPSPEAHTKPIITLPLRPYCSSPIEQEEENGE
ncbi:hypothetical protein V8G54_007042 [Vigna mungo]|uniref:Uncharacterized protein n=1 Tax=Vigna mungo TaxID=3915 RepID=A0AAQ3P2K1_VIGMU